MYVRLNQVSRYWIVSPSFLLYRLYPSRSTWWRGRDMLPLLLPPLYHLNVKNGLLRLYCVSTRLYRYRPQLFCTTRTLSLQGCYIDHSVVLCYRMEKLVGAGENPVQKLRLNVTHETFHHFECHCYSVCHLVSTRDLGVTNGKCECGHPVVIRVTPRTGTICYP